MTNSTQFSGPLLHVGYHKTGTTYLQKLIFNSADAGFVSPFSRSREIAPLLIYPPPFCFDADGCRNHFRPPIADAQSRGVVPVLSLESLSGNPHVAGYNARENANRLHQIFPDGRVVIAIREQKSMIYSSYKQYVRVGGTASLRDYLDPPFYRERVAMRAPHFHYGYFQYHGLIEYYFELFGRENVLVLLFEELVKSPRNFVHAIIDFAGATRAENLPYEQRVHPGLTGTEADMKRRLNFIAAYDSINPSVLVRSTAVKKSLDRAVRVMDALLPASFKKSRDAKMKSLVKEMVGDRYRESNRRVGQLLDMDLGSYGYDV
jgi:hypothetical protein